MRTNIGRALLALLALTAVSPTAVWAHPGHHGNHSWLYGALQPFMALDHFLAALFVVGIGAVVFAVAGRMRAKSVERRPERGS